MRASWMENLPITGVRAALRPARPWSHGEPALALRGALGAAVLHIACVRDRPDCPACDHRHQCVVPTWFDPARAGGHGARPFWLRVDPTPDGLVTPEAPLELRWMFVGPVPRPGLVLEAVQRAAALGLGEHRVPHMAEVESETSPLSELVRELPADAPLAVRSRSRLRLRRDGRILNRPTTADLVEAMVLRIRSLERSLGRSVAPTWPAPTRLPGPSEVRFVRASRFSTRQGRQVDLAGVEGCWLLSATDARPYLDLFSAAEVLQVGAATSVGLGSIAVAVDRCAPGERKTPFFG